MQRFDIDGRTRWFRPRSIAEDACRPLKNLVFLLFDLVGVHVELLGQFHQRPLASNGGECHLCLESRAVVPAGSSRHGLSCSRHLSRSQAEIPLILAVQISRATSLTDGRIEFDNNAVERTIRPIALNRKNALFAGHDAGAENWAVIASLIETCKLNFVDPYAWLADTLHSIVANHKQNRINELLSWNFAAKV